MLVLQATLKRNILLENVGGKKTKKVLVKSGPVKLVAGVHEGVAWLFVKGHLKGTGKGTRTGLVQGLWQVLKTGKAVTFAEKPIKTSR